MMGRKFLLLAMLAPAAPALADDEPLILPSRDVAVEYRTSGVMPGPSAEQDTVVARFASKSSRIRIDGSDRRFYMILDIDAERMIMVMPEWRLYMEKPADPGLMAMFQESGPALRRTGAEIVAGVRCMDYDAAVNDRTGQVCLTEDGVLLRANIFDPDRRREVQAVRVTYAEQPEAYFDRPPGFARVDASKMPPGLGSGPVVRGPRHGYRSGQTGR